jgi:hypothetical protein
MSSGCDGSATDIAANAVRLICFRIYAPWISENSMPLQLSRLPLRWVINGEFLQLLWF